MKIDAWTFDKVKLYPPGKQNPPYTYDQFHRGYAGRRDTPKSIVVHTTNGKRGTSLWAEARFIYQSQDISAHYLVGKDGEILQFLDPTIVAYHAGSVWPAYRYFGNPYSIGIECHHAVGEEWTTAQKDALFDLCNHLCKIYNMRLIDTHRKIAQPAGRKVDPSDFSDSDFYYFTGRILSTHEKYATAYNCHVREEPSTSARITQTIPKNTTIVVQEVVSGERYRDNPDWCKLETGGYIWKNLLRKL